MDSQNNNIHWGKPQSEPQRPNTPGQAPVTGRTLGGTPIRRQPVRQSEGQQVRQTAQQLPQQPVQQPQRRVTESETTVITEQKPVTQPSSQQKPLNQPSSKQKSKKMKEPDNRNFFQRHLIIFNLLSIIFLGCLLSWIAYMLLDVWTRHGDERTVPNVIGQKFADGESILKNSDLTVIISDSTYDDPAAPGTILDQNPHEGARVKNGRTIYVTIKAFSEKEIQVPNLDISGEQAIAHFHALGMTNVDTVMRIQEDRDGLLLEAQVNGHRLRAGDKIPISSHLTLVIGMNPPIERPTYSEFDEIDDIEGVEGEDGTEQAPNLNQVGTHPTTLDPAKVLNAVNKKH